MTFDPTKHKFGMAYKTDYMAICFPSKTVSSRLVYCCHKGADRLSEENTSQLTRAPEHDLIPVSVADKLVDVLKLLRRGNITINQGLTIDEALQEYNQLRQKDDE